MHSKLRLLLLAAVTAAGTLLVIGAAKRMLDAKSASLVVRPPTWRYPNEQSWLVAETLGAIAGLVHFANTGAVAEPAALDFAVTDRELTQERAAFDVRRRDRKQPAFGLTITDHVFSPAAFRPVAAGWLRQARPRAARASSTILDKLVDLRMETLHWTHKIASEEVTRDPNSPSAHEDAALVVAALALRESAAGHTDYRRLLTRAAAHLAVAGALRGSEPASMSGRLAELSILVLAGRNGDAAARIEKETSASDSERAWLRALRLFATQDWRAIAWQERVSLIERLAWFRAYKARVGATDRAYSLLEALTTDEQGLPDWGRIRLTDWPSVRDCHVYAVGGFPIDLAEAELASDAFRDMPLGDVAEALNAESPISPVVAVDGQPRVEVLDWGMVASFLQRHLTARLSYETACYENVFGLPEKTPEAVRAQETLFGRLRLFPLDAHRWLKTSASYRPFADAAARLVTERPDLVTPHLWKQLLQDPIFGPSPTMPRAAIWFDPPMPFGTTFDNDTRVEARHVSLDELIRIDPFDTGARWARTKQRFGETPPYETTLEAFGPAIEWDVEFMPTLAHLAKDRPEEKRRWLERTCSVDADECNQLAGFLLETKDETGAADVYRKWWKEASNRVSVSNDVAWLVEHDRKHGRLDEAWRIARDAASTYSGGGLGTLAKLAEATGRLDVAEDNYRKLADRYEQADVLYEFYTRQIEAGGKRFAQPREALVNQAFPDGLEAVATPPSKPPSDGASVWEVQPAARDAGVRVSDVIVGLDGVRIHSRSQWRLVWLHRPSAERRILLYRAGRYTEITGRFEHLPIPLRAQTYPLTR